jgi:hypothetical protein
VDVGIKARFPIIKGSLEQERIELENGGRFFFRMLRKTPIPVVESAPVRRRQFFGKDMTI